MAASSNHTSFDMNAVDQEEKDHLLPFSTHDITPITPPISEDGNEEPTSTVEPQRAKASWSDKVRLCVLRCLPSEDTVDFIAMMAIPLLIVAAVLYLMISSGIEVAAEKARADAQAEAVANAQTLGADALVALLAEVKKLREAVEVLTVAQV